MNREVRHIVDGDLEQRPVVAAASAFDPEEFLNKRQLAERLKITVRTVENWMAAGVVPFVKVRKVVLFQWHDVVDHLRRNFRICRKS